MATYDPDLYAALHRGTHGDVEFYGKVCAGATAILELGCGFGRMLAALAKPGRTVVGLELDEGLRALAGDRVAGLPDVEIVAGDMRTFSLGRSFDRVLIPHSGIYCLLTEDEVVACLTRARKHLAPGGEIVFDAYLADEFHHNARPEDLEPAEQTPVGEVSHGGVRYTVSESSTWDPDRQRMDVTYAYSGDDGSHHGGLIRQRYLLSAQIEPLLRRAGLDLRAMAGDFDGRPVDDDGAEVLVVVATAIDSGPGGHHLS